MIDIGHHSPHGSELMDEKNRLCGDLAIDSEKRFQRMLTRAFKRADEGPEIDLRASGLSASEAAELFARAVDGLKSAEIRTDPNGNGVAPFLSCSFPGP